MPETYAVPMRTMARDAESQSMLSVRNLQKVFGRGDAATRALDGVSFDVKKGEYLAIMGPSGSGKTTLLNCISTIDRPSKGQIVAAGRDVTALGRRSLAKFRRDELGFIFQDFNLLDTLTGRENIELALTIKKVSSSKIPKLVEEIAETLGVSDVLGKYPSQMSGGQKQRVAAARAIVSDPKLILADEPTGALDSHSAGVLLEMMETMNSKLGATIVMVTHDSFAASFAQRVLFLKDGRAFTEIRRGDATRERFFMQIMDVVSFLSGGISPSDRRADAKMTVSIKEEGQKGGQSDDA